MSTDERLAVVGEAADGHQAVELARQLRPDIIAMDLHLPDIDGVETTRRILADNPDIGVLVLTMSDDDDAVIAALRVGARGYLLKEAGPAEVLAALVSVGEGATVLGPGIGQRLTGLMVGSPRQTDGAPFPELTEREREVLDLIARGHSNAAIAHRLVISPKTVRNHISNIFAKLQVQARAEAIVRARDGGLGQ